MAFAAVCVLVFGATHIGVLNITQLDEKSPVVIKGVVHNLPAGLHGFHVHEFGNLTDDCMGAGAHYNPTNKTHGGQLDQERHVGDLGNIKLDNMAESNVSLTDNIIKLTGPYSIIGRSIVIHESEDDLGKTLNPLSKTTGNSGKRIACGIIARADPKIYIPNGASSTSQMISSSLLFFSALLVLVRH